MTAVRVELLGPLRLAVEGTPVDVPGPKRRAVLALLAAAEGRVVTADHLLDALWPTEPPESGRAALQSHVSRLRRHLGREAPRLAAAGGGRALAGPGARRVRRRRPARNGRGRLRAAAPRRHRPADRLLDPGAPA